VVVETRLGRKSLGWLEWWRRVVGRGGYSGLKHRSQGDFKGVDIIYPLFFFQVVPVRIGKQTLHNMFLRLNSAPQLQAQKNYIVPY
jgi:hypothetical protein